MVAHVAFQGFAEVREQGGRLRRGPVRDPADQVARTVFDVHLHQFGHFFAFFCGIRLIFSGFDVLVSMNPPRRFGRFIRGPIRTSGYGRDFFSLFFTSALVTCTTSSGLRRSSTAAICLRRRLCFASFASLRFRRTELPSRCTLRLRGFADQSARAVLDLRLHQFGHFFAFFLRTPLDFSLVFAYCYQ